MTVKAKRTPARAFGVPRRPALLAAVVWAACGGAAAQSPANPTAAPGAVPLAPAPAPRFAIQGFQVGGENPLGEAETARILAPYVRPDASMDTLQQATAALEKALRDRGFGLHRVALPPQDVGQRVRLEIVTFTISKVAIEGRSLYGEDNIRRSVPELQEGRTPNFKRLAIQSAIANENPNKQVQLNIRESDEPDRIDATLLVKESRPWTFGVSVSNAGSESTGRDRLSVSGGHTNLFDRDHQFIGAYTTSLARTSDVMQLGLSYRVPLYQQGGVVGLSHTRSDVVGNFGAFTSTGAGHTFGLNYTLYLPPEGGRRSYLTLGLEDKVFDAAKINDIVVPGQQDRRSRPLVLGYSARMESDASVWGYNLDLAVNTGTGANNDLASLRSEDPRIDRLHWKALRGGISYLAPVAGNWLLGARGAFQYSPDVLISGEQFGLGGLSSVRGTRIERPVSGDAGVSASVELTTPELAPGLRLLSFADAGWLSNQSANGTSKPSSDRLVSVGLGLRYAAGMLGLTADYGRIVSGSRASANFNAAAPRRGEDKLYVSASLRF
jgi:hemolysin activation/secretion protein